MKNLSVLEHIKSYGFSVEKVKEGEGSIYHCRNEASKRGFLLVNLDQNLTMPEEKVLLEEMNRYNINRIFYLIHLKDKEEEVLEFAESIDNDKNILLVYDEREDVEFFLKDLWNAIIQLKD